MLWNAKTVTTPSLLRIKCADLDHGSARHIRGLRLESDGGRTVARATEVRGRVWKDFAGAHVLASSDSLGDPVYSSIVLSRRCVERFVTPEDVVFDVDLSGLQSGRKGKWDLSKLDYVALVPHGGVDFAEKIWRYDSLGANSQCRYALMDTWDGTDYVTQRSQRLDFFCSLRVVETARAERWTGFGFHPADLSIGVQALWQGVDYLGDQWPPSRWYPPDPATFTGVADWVAALDEVGDRAGLWVTLMMREFDEWASQDALDWLAGYITQHEPGTQMVDYAAFVYMFSAARHAERYRFDPVALERAHEINLQTRSLGLAALRKRYGRSR